MKEKMSGPRILPHSKENARISRNPEQAGLKYTIRRRITQSRPQTERTGKCRVDHFFFRPVYFTLDLRCRLGGPIKLTIGKRGAAGRRENRSNREWAKIWWSRFFFDKSRQKSNKVRKHKRALMVGCISFLQNCSTEIVAHIPWLSQNLFFFWMRVTKEDLS